MRLVYVAPVPYSSFAQRPHRFVAFFNRRTRGRTLWIDPYPGRWPRLADLGRARPRTCPHVEEALEVASPPIWAADPAMALPSIRRLVWKPVLERVEAFTEGADWLLVIGRPSRLALHLLRRTGPRPTCYDAMDDFPEFYSGLARALSRRIENEIAHGVDDILASSTALQDKFGRRGLAAELLPNGLRTCPKALEPELGDARDELVLGYVGTIGDWFDWPLVAEMALSLPEARFEITGPEMVAPKMRLPANVHRAGECAGHEVFGRLQGLIAGLIPFKLNRLTAAIDPIKYYEYRAAGLPVIATEFGEMRRRRGQPGVHLIAGGADFRAVLKNIKANPRLSAGTLERFRAENSWRSRFERSRFFRKWTATEDD